MKLRESDGSSENLRGSERISNNNHEESRKIWKNLKDLGRYCRDPKRSYKLSE